MIKKESELKNAELKLQHCQSKIDNLSNHEYDPDCQYCVNNVFVKDAKDAEVSLWGLKQDRDELIFEIKELNNYIFKDIDVYSKIEAVLDFEQKLVDCEKNTNIFDKKLITLKEKKLSLEKEIMDIEILIIKFEENKEAIKTNLKFNSEIEIIENHKIDLNKKLRNLENDIITCSSDLKVHEQIISDCEESINKLQELENEFYAYDFYLKTVNRNGLPYDLISNALPKIQSETNNILSQIVEFQILFDTDGKSINTYIVYDDDNFWPLEITSGMEKFISSLAIRTASIQVSSLPRPNFIAIDEGLGVLDPSILTNFSVFLDYLKTQFDFVILISHIDIVRDIVDSQIEIKKEKGFSKINN